MTKRIPHTALVPNALPENSTDKTIRRFAIETRRAALGIVAACERILGYQTTTQQLWRNHQRRDTATRNLARRAALKAARGQPHTQPIDSPSDS